MMPFWNLDVSFPLPSATAGEAMSATEFHHIFTTQKIKEGVIGTPIIEGGAGGHGNGLSWAMPQAKVSAMIDARGRNTWPSGV